MSFLSEIPNMILKYLYLEFLIIIKCSGCLKNIFQYVINLVVFPNKESQSWAYLLSTLNFMILLCVSELCLN